MSQLHRLRAHANPQPKRPRVDRSGDGRINGISIATRGEALGHGFDLDDVSLDQIAELAGGAKGRWTHGNLCADGLGKHLGRVDPSSVKREGDHVFGDFAFSARAHEFQPDGLTVSAAEYLMSMAEDEPDALGVSIVFRGESVESEDAATGLAARVDSVPRVDFVADPAANPDGLFAGSGSELSANATQQLDEIVNAIGLGRAAAFAQAYLKERGMDLSSIELTTELTSDTVGDVTELRAELDSLKAEHAKITAELGAYRKAEAERRAAEIAGYVESLKADSAELQSPISAADLGDVEELFSLGRDEQAKRLGAALLKTAKLEAKAGAFERDEQANSQPKGLTEAEAEAKILRRAGYTVELSADRKTITNATRQEG